MPDKATEKQAVRESDQNQIIEFCQLPANMTKRSLLLKAFEDMMKETMKERDFSFLDRNYVEEFKDASTLRQVLCKAMTLNRADVQTKYFDMDDGLLVSLYYKNPPGSSKEYSSAFVQHLRYHQKGQPSQYEQASS